MIEFYNPMSQARFKLGAFAIITDGQKVLLCHRRDMDLWNLPGGKVEAGESPWGAVIREVREETGLEVEILRLHGVYFKPEVDEVVFSFLCEVKGGKLTPSGETDRMNYFEIASLPDNLSPKQAKRIMDAFDETDKLVLKEQTGPSSRELFDDELRAQGI